MIVRSLIGPAGVCCVSFEKVLAEVWAKKLKLFGAFGLKYVLLGVTSCYISNNCRFYVPVLIG